MFHALMRGIAVVTNRGANTNHLIRGNTDAHAAATNQNATLGLSVDNRFAHELREIRLVVVIILVEIPDIER